MSIPRETFWADILTASVKVGKANCISANCSGPGGRDGLDGSS